MTLQATVVVPTHDHGPTLLRSVRSALEQTIEDIEVLIVGDGVPSTAREVALAIAASDERVTFHDNPKGPRHGEIHRHHALGDARGKIVCYLADDDLWLPDHVETMIELLAEADFAHALPVRIQPDGSVFAWTVDLAIGSYREMLASGVNRIPLSCGAHTLAFYRRLPYGWRTTPDSVPTDLFMWNQILSQPECRAVSGRWPTVLNFPSPQRAGWRLNERLVELDHWYAACRDPEQRLRFVRDVLGVVVRDRARFAARRDLLEQRARRGEN